jgi:hypothetical protein
MNKKNTVSLCGVREVVVYHRSCEPCVSQSYMCQLSSVGVHLQLQWHDCGKSEFCHITSCPPCAHQQAESSQCEFAHPPKFTMKMS